MGGISEQLLVDNGEKLQEPKCKYPMPGKMPHQRAECVSEKSMD